MTDLVPIHTGNVVLTEQRLREVLEYFLRQEAFAFDVETIGEYRNVPVVNEVIWLSLATEGLAVSIPMGHPNGDVLLRTARKKKNRETGKFDMFPPEYDEPPRQLSRRLVFDILEPLFFDPDKVKIAHNAKFDILSIAKYYDNRILPGRKHDTIVMQHLVDENLRSKGLKDLIIKYWNMKYDFENVGKKVEIHPFSKVAHYGYMDARYTYFLWKLLMVYFEEGQPLREVFELELNDGKTGSIDVFCAMGLVGTRLDVDVLLELRETLTAQLLEIETRIYRLAGKKFLIGSPTQKAEILYGSKESGGLGLKCFKTTDTGNPSVDEESLRKHEGVPLVDALLEYAETSKILSTYVIGYLGEEGNKNKLTTIFNGKVHTDFVQFGTVTGRASSRSPNLQNVPNSSTELGTKLRKLFIADEGDTFVVADYGQIEMFLLADYIGKGALYEGIMNGMDPHSATGAELIGMEVEEFMRKKELNDPEIKKARSIAKGVNFSVVYGAGPDKVAAMAGVSLPEAKRFLKLHQKSFPEIYSFKEKVIRTCRERKDPHITTMMGRKRRLPKIRSRQQEDRAYAERQAVNSLIQGSAADIMKKAMIVLYDTLPDDMHILLTVHDELVVSCPQDKVETCQKLVHEAMLGEHILGRLKVPLSADIESGPSWGHAK